MKNGQRQRFLWPLFVLRAVRATLPFSASPWFATFVSAETVVTPRHKQMLFAVVSLEHHDNFWQF